MTPEFRLDVPCDVFSPLSRTLLAESGRPRVEIDLLSVSVLPKLTWTPRPKPKEKVKQQPTSQRKSDQQSEEISQRVSQVARQPRKVQPVKDQDVVQERIEQDPRDVLRKQAESYRQTGDYLSAAICFALADDRANAARCYREAAQSIVSG